MKPGILSKLIVILCCSTSSAFALNYDESIDGPLSNDPSNPTMLDLDPGSNVLRANTDTALTGADYVAFTIGPSEILTAVTLLDFTSSTQDNRGFLGIGDSSGGFPTTIPIADDLIGGLLYGEDEINDDLLEISNVGFPALQELGPGSYFFWFNETSDENFYSVDFQIDSRDPSPVPVPAPALLILGPLALLMKTAVRKRV